MTHQLTQNGLLLSKLLEFYKKDGNMEKILPIINGESNISLRLILVCYKLFKKVLYSISFNAKNGEEKDLKYIDYKLKLKAYSKRRFDPFCRWERITIPYENDCYIQQQLVN